MRSKLEPSTCFSGIICPECVARVELDVFKRDYKSSSMTSPGSIESIANCRPQQSHSCRQGGYCCNESTSPLSTTATHTTKYVENSQNLFVMFDNDLHGSYQRQPRHHSITSYSLLTQFAIAIYLIVWFLYSFNCERHLTESHRPNNRTCQIKFGRSIDSVLLSDCEFEFDNRFFWRPKHAGWMPVYEYHSRSKFLVERKFN